MTLLNRARAKVFFAMAMGIMASAGIDHAAAQTNPVCRRQSIFDRPYPDYLRHCVRCHGADGTGRDAEVARIRGQDFYYLRAQFYAFLTGGRRHPEMSQEIQKLRPENIDDILCYYSNLRPQ